MRKNKAKNFRSTSSMILTIIIFSLLNICLFVSPVIAAKPAYQPFNLSVFTHHVNGDVCAMEPIAEPSQTISYPTAAMPECCLARNRNFNALINTNNDKKALTFIGYINLTPTEPILKNNFTYHPRLTYPPPTALALASTVIRE
jgi:hypothetical protein